MLNMEQDPYERLLQLHEEDAQKRQERRLIMPRSPGRTKTYESPERDFTEEDALRLAEEDATLFGDAQ